MRSFILALIIMFLGLPSVAQVAEYTVGVYYFPGWADRQIGAEFEKPWDKIKPFPDREPLLGWYKDGTEDVARQQIDWMADYGIKFVAYDWYWSKSSKVFLNHAITAHFLAPNRERVKVSLLWANHDGVPDSRDNFDHMINYWIDNYFHRSEYLRINNKPVVFIFSADLLRSNASKFGATTGDLLSSAQAIARKRGLKGIYFVAGTGAGSPMIDSYAKISGYSALSAYNYHEGLNSTVQSHSYAELDSAYQEHWTRFLNEGNLPLIVPMTAGWDKRPWGGSRDPLHDNSVGTSQEFESHLRAAKKIMDSGRFAESKLGVICCWNEFGEGSFIEPTKKDGFSYLHKVKKVFDTP